MNNLKLYSYQSNGVLEQMLDKLDLKQLNLSYQGIKEELRRYLIAIQNYSPDRLERFGLPHKERIQKILFSLENEINKRTV